MTTKEKAVKAGILTAIDTAFDKASFNAIDPVKGWYSLAQPAKDRKQKARLKKAQIGKQNGQIDAGLAGQLVFLVVIVLLLVVGVVL